MGYVNPVIQFGIEQFCRTVRRGRGRWVDLTRHAHGRLSARVQSPFEKYGLLNIFLVTPQTSEARIRQIDSVSEGFIYTVSSASVTGSKTGVSDNMETYFDRINAMNLRNPRLIGFGIKDRATFDKACRYAHGAIIGSAFIRILQDSKALEREIKDFIGSIKANKPTEIDV